MHLGQKLIDPKEILPLLFAEIRLCYPLHKKQKCAFLGLLLAPLFI